MSDLLTLLQNRGFSPRKISTSHNGEFCSPCPVCGDGGKGKESDRFHIWPERVNDGKCIGRFWCRQCGLSGDTIAFLQKVDGLNFQQACAELGIPLDKTGPVHYSRYQPPPVASPTPHSWSPKNYCEPPALWREKAGNLLADCQQRLIGTPSAMSWLAERGLTEEMVRTYGLGYNLSSKGKDRYRPRTLWGLPEKIHGNKAKRLWIPRGWVISSRNQSGQLIQLRIRRLNEDIVAFASDIKYLPLDGSSMATMVLHPEAEVFSVVECGFDAILLAALTEGKIGAITTWNDSARPDTFAHSLLSRSSCILGGLDYDQAGDNQQEWWQGQYRQYRRLPALPGGAKDPGDAIKGGTGLADLRSWLISGLPRGLQIKMGFAGRRKPQVAGTAQTDQTVKTQPDSVAPCAEIFELELVGGKVVYVTNDQDQWTLLTSQGKAVFSQNELERLQVALSGLSEEDRSVAISRAIEAKEVFGGYIQAGRESSRVADGEF